jgi:tetratricopeptide (TPR) repeat protein
VRGAIKDLERSLDRARTEPARDAGPRVLAALRAAAAATGQAAAGQDGVGDLVRRIEIAAYSPKAASEPLDGALLDSARACSRRWLCAGRPTTRGGAGVAAALGPWLLVAGMGDARAQETGQAAGQAAPAAGVSIDEARAVYQQALGQGERDARTRDFARAERLFRQLVKEHPGRPELLTDWGNAALGAYDLGRAILAYRRALALDRGLHRAERNLSWARSRLPEWLPRPAREGTWDSLFFWHRALSVPARHLLGAVAFAAVILLILPWRRRPPVWRWSLAIVMAVLWLAMVGSALLDRPPRADAVVVADEVPLLAADNPGAPRALPDPLPAGAELVVQEEREDWARVSVAGGAIGGWIPSTAMAHVIPR